MQVIISSRQLQFVFAVMIRSGFAQPGQNKVEQNIGHGSSVPMLYIARQCKRELRC